ncbi:MAG: GFA family protein [Caulobacteraceae bacterium]
MSAGEGNIWRAGGCHCGAVRFEAALPREIEAQDCNCSICAKTGFLHVIVPENRFRLTAGADQLTTYTFNTHTARHLFCQVCGVKSFYRPRSNPDGWSINAHCLDDLSALEITVSNFEGRDWERHAGELAHLSKEAS